MFNENINNTFKVSNNLNLTRWNPTMSTQTIHSQLEVSY